MSDPYDEAWFCKECGEEVFTSLESFCGACLACSRFASMEDYEADFDAWVDAEIEGLHQPEPPREDEY